MTAQPANPKRNQGLSLVALACLLALQSCNQENKAATECYQLQEVINTKQSFSIREINKASETAQAQTDKALAEALSVVELSDPELQERRDRITSLAQQQHTLSLQAADIMTEDGYLSDNADTQYSSLSTQRSTLYDQMFTEQNSLQIYCSLL